MSKPKLCFLTHSDTIHPRQFSLLSEKFRVTCVGADWSRGQLKAPKRLRGHDCIICQTVYHAAMCRAWSPGTPYIIENHGDLLNRNPIIAKYVINLASGLRATSQFTAKELSQYTTNEVSVFQPWLNRTLFERIKPTGHWSNIYGRPLILYLGGPHHHKGSEVVNETNTYLKHKITKLFGLEQRIAAEIISDADCVVVPSLYEGFGLVPIEAMLVGVPVVASRTGGLKENLTDEVARLVTPGNAVELGGAIELTLTKTGKTREQVKRAKEWAQGFVDERAHVRGFSDLVRRII